VIYTSATPGPYELEQSANHVVQQIIRTTAWWIRKSKCARQDFQVDMTSSANQETGQPRLPCFGHHPDQAAWRNDLTEYLNELNIRVRYMHSDVQNSGTDEI